MNKIDDLEKFVQEERELFDVKIPAEKIWENISKQVNPHTLRTVWYRSNLFRSIAAGFTLLVIGGTLGFLWQIKIRPFGIMEWHRNHLLISKWHRKRASMKNYFS